MSDQRAFVAAAVYRADTRTLPDGTIFPVFALVNSPADRRFLLTNPSEYFLRYVFGSRPNVPPPNGGAELAVAGPVARGQALGLGERVGSHRLPDGGPALLERDQHPV